MFAVEGVCHGRGGGRRDGDVFRAPGEGENGFVFGELFFRVFGKIVGDEKQAAEESVCRGERRFLLGRKGGVAVAEQKHVGVVQERSARELTAKDRVQNGIFR